MTTRPVLLVLLAMAIAINATAQMQVPLYDSTIPGGRQTQMKETFLKSDDGIPLVKNIANPSMFLFLPETMEPVPCVLIFAGGGYEVQAFEHEGNEVARRLNAEGIAAAVIRYSLPADGLIENKSIGPLQDAQQAILTIRENAAAWNIMPHKTGLLGFSAGGHLAATAGTHFQNPVIKHGHGNEKVHHSLRPDFMVLIYPVISMTDSLTHLGSRRNLLGQAPGEELINFFSNELHVDGQTPPTFRVHAKDDPAVPVANSLNFASKLKAHNIPYELFLYEKGGHGFGLVNKLDNRDWLRPAIDWIRNL